jgi:aspartate aminotransferase
MASGLRAMFSSPALHSRVDEIRGSPIREIARLIARSQARHEIISLGGGAPSFPPPPEVLERWLQMLRQGGLAPFTYGETAGLGELREAFALDLRQLSGAELDADRQVLVTDGSQEALFLATQVLIEPGDEVIIFDPTYVAYESLVRLAGGRPVRVALSREGRYRLPLERLKEAISRRTKLVIYASPDNPTGRMLERREVRALAELAKEHGFYLLSDEAYRRIVYEGEHAYLLSEDAGERALSCFTASKEVNAPGARIGFLAGPPELIERCEKLKQLVSLMPSLLGQTLALAFYTWEGREGYIRDVVLPAYRERRDAMGRALEEALPEAGFIWPQGAFYFFVDLRRYLAPRGLGEEALALRALESEKVALIPGNYFGPGGAGHVRLTFVSEGPERIREAIGRLRRLLGAS